MLDRRLSVHLRARFQFPKTRILPYHHAPLVYGMQSTRETEVSERSPTSFGGSMIAP